jgi:cytochrome c oxidase subunit IV
MSHLSYETSKKIATKTILILAGITIFEVAFALLGKGYLIEGIHFPVIIVGGLMIIMSIVKAWLIIFEFMHMKYEVPALVKTVLLPLFLLVWAVISFLCEGDFWNVSRASVKNKVQIEVSEKKH